jgi:hypothetical protein
MMMPRAGNVIRLFVGEKLYGERRWTTVPTVGHKIMYRTGGVPALAEVLEVVWGGTEQQAIIDVHCRHCQGVVANSDNKMTTVEEIRKWVKQNPEANAGDVAGERLLELARKL